MKPLHLFLIIFKLIIDGRKQADEFGILGQDGLHHQRTKCIYHLVEILDGNQIDMRLDVVEKQIADELKGLLLVAVEQGGQHLFTIQIDG